MDRKSRKKFLNKAKPWLVLAPMAGYSDQPFRLICKEFGADILFSEMVSSEALWYNAKPKIQSSNVKSNSKSKIQILKTLELIRFSQKERPFIVQIFGADHEHMAFAAEYLASGKWADDYKKILSSNIKTLNKSQIQSSKFQTDSLGFRISDLGFTSIPNGIDVNMGCPVRDIIRQGAGAALMKKPVLALEIVKSIKKKIKIPLSVKIRLGWNSSQEIISFAKQLEAAGVDMLTVHGRTVKQGFSGEVDWSTIYQIKKNLKIPVIGNGGVSVISNVKSQMSNLDGIMIGRGALGDPWIFQDLKNQISNVKSSGQQLITNSVSINERKKIVLRHAQLVKKIHGERGMVEFRKHLAWYFKGVIKDKTIKNQLMMVRTLNELKNVLAMIRD